MNSDGKWKRENVFTKLFSDSSEESDNDSLDEWLNDATPHEGTDVLCMYENEHTTPGSRPRERGGAARWEWSKQHKQFNLIPPVMEKLRPKVPVVALTSDYTPQRIREKGPKWFVSTMFKQLEKEPMGMDHVGNIAVLMTKSFPIVIFNKRASKTGRKTTELIRQIMANLDISDNALLDILIDAVNSRAAKKIFKDLNLITGLKTLPVIFVNETLIGNYESLKRSSKVGALVPMIKDAVDIDLSKCPDCR